MILYLNNMNKNYFFSNKENQRYSDPKASIGFKRLNYTQNKKIVEKIYQNFFFFSIFFSVL